MNAPAALSAQADAPSARLHRPPPTRAAAAQPRELRVCIIGELAEDAHACVEPATGRAAVSVVLAQGYGAPKVLATQWLGDGVDAICDSEYQAALMPAGTVVEVDGASLRMRYHHGALALLVGTVRSIRPAPRDEQRVACTAAARPA